MVIYTIIFGYVFKAKEEHFPLFVFIGVTMWGFFSKVLHRSVKLIKAKKGIITKVYIPKTILLLILLAENAFKMCLSFGLIAIMMFIWRIPVSIHLLYVFPVMLAFFMLCYGICCFLMHFGVYVEDLDFITEILLKMMFYFTGIFYSIEKRVPKPWGKWLANYNPVAFLINSMRKAMLYRKHVSLMNVGIWFGIAFVIAIIGTRLIYKRENSYAKVI